MRFLKMLIGLAGLAAFVWFGANIRLGSSTLFEHLQAIGSTRETRDLLDGTRESAKPYAKTLLDSIRRRLAGSGDRGSAGAGGRTDETPPHEEVSQSDRQGLRKLLEGSHSARQHDVTARVSH